MLPSCRSKYHARISGKAIFMISDGWMFADAGIFNQRQAPFTHFAANGNAQQQHDANGVQRHRKTRDELRR